MSNLGATTETRANDTSVTFSRGFTDWLGINRVSLAVSSYQSGAVFFVGRGPKGHVAVTSADFRRSMGLYVQDNSLWIGTIAHVWRLENVLNPGSIANDRHDRLYVPRAAFTVGDVDMHELAVGMFQKPIFVNTKFSCLATISEKHAFQPVWKPPFISKLAAEDRCHLNGLAMESGRPRYVTAVSTSDVALSWKEHRYKGGVLIDVLMNEIITVGLSMPHSPRIHAGAIWLLDSGRGWLCRVDRETGDIERITFCPGFLRGLSFHGDYAVVTASLPRDGYFKGLELEDAIKDKGGVPRCAVFIIDLKSGDIVEWMRLEGAIKELFDVAVLPGALCPMALGPHAPEIRGLLTFEPMEEPKPTLTVAEAA